MSIGSRIKERRESLGLTQTQLAELLGVTKGAIGNYETDSNSPKASILYKVFDVLKCDANYLFQDEMKALETNDFTVPEIKMVKKYRTLDECGKEIVDFILDKESARSIEIMQKTVQTTDTKSPCDSTVMIEKIVYVNPAAAGVPLYAEDDFERIEFPASKVPKGTDFGVRISGDSMEPSIPDRAIVWVRKTPEIYDGQVGVFMIDNMAVCKRYHKEGEKIVLQSDNPAYEPIEITNFERFGIVGKVIGMTEEE